MTIREIQEEIIDEFNLCDDWMERYEYLIELGKSLPLIDDQYKNYEKAAILEFEESKLSDKYPEYKALVKEYHDGIILYEIMSDKVWNKAVKDTSGLKKFFEQNRSKYTWSDRIDATVYECLNNEIAETVFKMIKNDTINSKHVLDIINKDSELNLKVKMNKFEINQVSYLKNRSFNLGVNPIFEFEGKYYALKVSEIIKPRGRYCHVFPDTIIINRLVSRKNTINFFIQGAIAAGNNCAEYEANRLYNQADNMLNTFLKSNCGCSGNNYQINFN